MNQLIHETSNSGIKPFQEHNTNKKINYGTNLKSSEFIAMNENFERTGHIQSQFPHFHVIPQSSMISSAGLESFEFKNLKLHDQFINNHESIDKQMQNLVINSGKNGQKSTTYSKEKDFDISSNQESSLSNPAKLIITPYNQSNTIVKKKSLSVPRNVSGGESNEFSSNGYANDNDSLNDSKNTNQNNSSTNYSTATLKPKYFNFLDENLRKMNVMSNFEMQNNLNKNENDKTCQFKENDYYYRQTTCDHESMVDGCDTFLKCHISPTSNRGVYETRKSLSNINNSCSNSNTLPKSNLKNTGNKKQGVTFDEKLEVYEVKNPHYGLEVKSEKREQKKKKKDKQKEEEIIFKTKLDLKAKIQNQNMIHFYVRIILF